MVAVSHIATSFTVKPIIDTILSQFQPSLFVKIHLMLIAHLFLIYQVGYFLISSNFMSILPVYSHIPSSSELPIFHYQNKVQHCIHNLAHSFTCNMHVTEKEHVNIKCINEKLMEHSLECEVNGRMRQTTNT
jgi:hypothetical protein